MPPGLVRDPNTGKLVPRPGQSSSALKKKVKVKKAPVSQIPGMYTGPAGFTIYDPLRGHTTKDKQNQAKQKAYAATPKAYTKSHPELSGQERIDPGGGIVRYGGRNEKQYNAAVRARARRQRRIEAMLANEPRLEPLSATGLKHAQQHGYDPTNEAILRATGMDPLFQASARATGLSSFAKNYVLGPAISQPGFDPSNPWEYFDAALLLPFGRPVKGAFAAGAGAKAGVKALTRGAAKETEYQVAKRAFLGRAAKSTAEAERATEAAKAAAGAYYQGSGLAARAAGKIRWRAGALAGQHFWEPAARSQIGRGVERVTEAARQRLPLRRAPIVQSTGQKTGEEIQSFIKTQTKLLDYPARRLIKIGKKLNADQQYALRIVAEGIGPEEQAAYHRGLAAELGGYHPSSGVAHGIHSQRFEGAAKYVEQAPDGSWHIRSDAPARLREAERLFRTSNATRERIYTSMDLLTPEQMARRIQMPGSIIRGEDKLLEQIQANPIREKVRTELKTKSDLTDREIQDTLDALDAESLAISKMTGAPPDILYSSLHDFQAGGFPPDLAASFLLQAPGLELRSEGPINLARDILKRGLKVPPELDTPEKLSEAIQRVYALAKDGAHGKDWYDRAAEQIKIVSDATGLPPEKVAQVFAIYSQAADTVSNVTFASNALKQWHHFQQVYTGRFPEAQSKEVEAVMAGGVWEGRKRSAFYQNMLESYQKLYGGIDPKELSGKPVTVDRWVVRMFAPELGKDVPAQYYDVFEQLIQDMAARIGWEPKELQAAAWVAFKQQSLDQAKRKGVRHIAGAKDAFEYGVNKNFTGTLFETPPTHPETLKAVADLRQPDGGFTLRADLTDAKPTGYIAAYGAYEFKVEASKLKPRDLELYRDAHLAQLKDKRARVGGWHDPETGIGYLDISKEFATRRAAMKFAREQGQLAIFDTKTFKSIPTGLSEEEASAIKAGLKERQPVHLPTELSFKEKITKPDWMVAQDQHEAMLNDIAGKMGWPKTVESRQILEDLAWEQAQKHPDEVWSKNFLRSLHDAHAGPNLDEVIPPAPGEAMPPAEGPVGGDVHARRQTYDPTKDYVFGAHYRPDTALGGNEPWRIAVSKSGTDIAPQGTTLHEFAHQVYELLPPSKAGMLLEYARELGYAEADLAEFLPDALEAYLINPNARFPEGLKSSLERIKERVLKENLPIYEELGAIPGARNFPPEVMDLVDQLFNWSGFGDGRLYLMDRRGLPSSWRSPLSKINAYRHQMQVWTGHGRAQALSLMGRDPTTTHEYQGFLKKMGMFVGNATDSAGESGVKAARIGTFKALRDEVMPLATSIPHNVDDVAIKVDPSIDAPKELKRVMDMIRDFELDGKKINYAELKGIDFQAVLDLIDHNFPSELAGERTEVVAAKMIANDIQQPIDNIVWVSREALEGTKLFANPRALSLAEAGWAAEGLGKVFDTVNNGVKATMLWLSPAYYSMNFLGNLGMNLMQQGPYALLNLPKSAFLSRELGEYWAGQIDYLMGEGVTRATGEFMWGGNPAQHGFNILQETASKLVDQIPRRAAWLHEARRLGLVTNEDLIALLKGAAEGERQAIEHVHYITKRANDAIVDYERLNPIEKKVITRVIFFYPWIKGATRYTLRFPLEHPVQAMAYAALYERQQHEANDVLGQRPWYSYLEVPGSMVPGMPDTVNRGGQDYPYVFNPKQIATFTTPIELARSIGGFVTGQSGQQPFVETLTPVLQSAIEALAGRKSFDQADQPQSLGSFLRGIFAPPAVIKKIEEIAANQGADTNRLYPRNELDRILSLVLGSLAPKPYNVEKGQWLGRGHRGQPPHAEWTQKVAEYEKFAKVKLPPEIRAQVDAAISAKVRWEEMKDEAHSKKSNLTDADLGLLKLQLLEELRPEVKTMHDQIVAAINDPTRVSTITSKMDRALWGVLEKISARLGKYQRLEEKKKAAA